MTNPALPIAVPGAVGLEYVLFQFVFRLTDEAAIALQCEVPPVMNLGVPDKNIVHAAPGGELHICAV